jgi:GNAT superfamily N-acetyltransferase
LFAPDGEIAGLTYGRLSADRGPGLPKTRIVDSPGTAPAYRLAGLIRPLTLLTLQWLRTQGEGPLELHCFGEPEDVVEIYADLGFRLAPADHWVEYVRPVP